MSRYSGFLRWMGIGVSTVLICSAGAQTTWTWNQQCSNNEWRAVCSTDWCSANIPRYRNNWGQFACNAYPAFPQPGDNCRFPSLADALLDSYANVKSIIIDSNARFSWASGTLTLRDPSTNTRGVLTNAGTFRMIGDSSTSRFLSGRLNNTGTLIHEDGITYLDGVTLQNNGRAEISAGSWRQNFGNSVFLNRGTLTKTTDDEFIIIVPTDQRNARVDVLSGSLRIATDNTISRHIHQDVTWDVANNATIYLECSDTYTHVFVGTHGGVIQGALIQEIRQGLSSGTVQVGEDGATFNFTNNGYLWKSGTLDCGSTGLTNLGLIRMANHRGSLRGNLFNRGEIVHEDGETTFEDGTLHNDNTLDVRRGRWRGIGQGRIINRQTLKKTTADNFAIEARLVQQNATVTVQAGRLSLPSGTHFHQDVRWSVANGATLTVSGTFAGVHTGNIEGTLTSSDQSIIADSTGATFAFTGTGFVWQGGGLDGGSTGLTNTGLMIAKGDSDLRGKLINNGTLIYEDDSRTVFRLGILENNNTIILKKGRWSPLFAQNAIPVRNAGTLRKVSQNPDIPTSWTISLNTLNSGLIDVQSGTLVFGDITYVFLNQIAGETRIHRGATLQVDSPTSPRTYMELQGGKLTGAGRFRGVLINSAGTVAPGIEDPDQPNLNPLGVLTVAGSLELRRDAIFEVELAGVDNSDMSNPQYDQLVISGSRLPVVLNGTLRVKARNGYIPSRGSVFDIILLGTGSTWTRTGEFHTVEVDPETLPCGAFVVRYLNDRVRLVALATPDVNSDGCVDDSDLLAVLFTFGQTGNDLPADIDGNGVVEDTDLLSVLFAFGCGC